MIKKFDKKVVTCGLKKMLTQNTRNGRIVRVPSRIIVGIPNSIPLAVWKPFIVAVLRVVPISRDAMPVTVVLGHVSGILVPRIRKSWVVLRVVFPRDAVEPGVVAVAVPILDIGRLSGNVQKYRLYVTPD